MIIGFCQITNSQSKGQFKIITNPTKAIIRADTMLLKSNVTYSLDTGLVQLRMWYPKRRYYEKNVRIVEDSSIVMYKTLTFEEDYINYRNDLKRYKLKRFALRYIPVPLFAIASITGFNNIKSLKEDVDYNYQTALKAEKDYYNSYFPDDIQENRNIFETSKSNYDTSLKKLNRTKLTTYGTVAAGAVISWYLIRVSNRMKEPQYKEKNLLSKIDLGYWKIGKTESFKLTYNF